MKEKESRGYSLEEMVNLVTLDALVRIKDTIDEMEEGLPKGQTIFVTQGENKIKADGTSKAVWRGMRIGILRQAFDEGYGKEAMDVLK